MTAALESPRLDKSGRRKAKRTTSGESTGSVRSSTSKRSSSPYRRTKSNSETKKTGMDPNDILAMSSPYRRSKTSEKKSDKSLRKSKQEKPTLSPHEILQLLEKGASSGDGQLAGQYFDHVKKTAVPMAPVDLDDSARFNAAAEQAVSRRSEGSDPFADGKIMSASEPGRGRSSRSDRTGRSKKSSSPKKSGMEEIAEDATKSKRSLSPARTFMSSLGFRRQTTTPAAPSKEESPKLRRQVTAPQAAPSSPNRRSKSPRDCKGSPNNMRSSTGGSSTRKSKKPSQDPQDVLRMLEACASKDVDLGNMYMKGLMETPLKHVKKYSGP
ncbi:expressed unknown protein [Seminavis robusta]|uniref:Uncharacterized protein n=1 Tax=Seminavis robusta TaxID=568900 RepID=A0A9N8D8E4_9STRA|nr:expressed unknown protein [Seminavis robusta]|eukprot:Sro14_g010600.1 n/a (326) ;mRNA; f:92512-93489